VNDPDNPFIRARNLPQHVKWDALKIGQKYHLELILPFKGETSGMFGKTSYFSVCAEVMETAQLNTTHILKGEHITIDFAFRSFERSLMGATRLFRESLKEEDNIDIQFIKYNRRKMEFVKAERSVPTKEQTVFSEKGYEEIMNLKRRKEMYSDRRVKVRAPEEL